MFLVKVYTSHDSKCGILIPVCEWFYCWQAFSTAWSIDCLGNFCRSEWSLKTWCTISVRMEFEFIFLENNPPNKESDDGTARPLPLSGTLMDSWLARQELVLSNDKLRKLRGLVHWSTIFKRCASGSCVGFNESEAKIQKESVIRAKSLSFVDWYKKVARILESQFVTQLESYTLLGASAIAFFVVCYTYRRIALPKTAP